MKPPRRHWIRNLPQPRVRVLSIRLLPSPTTLPFRLSWQIYHAWRRLPRRMPIAVRKRHNPIDSNGQWLHFSPKRRNQQRVKVRNVRCTRSKNRLSNQKGRRPCWITLPSGDDHRHCTWSHEQRGLTPCTGKTLLGSGHHISVALLFIRTSHTWFVD